MILIDFWQFFGDFCSEYSEYLSFLGGSILTTHRGPDEQLGGEKKVGHCGNGPQKSSRFSSNASCSSYIVSIVSCSYAHIQT